MIEKIEEIEEKIEDDEPTKEVYEFSEEELDSLALFFRKNMDSLPENLDNFAKFVEYYIYGKMSIGEAEAFFNNNN